MIYILKHPKAGFTGYLSRSEFHDGRGSTNSKQDRDRLVKLGCKDITVKYWAEQKAKEAKEKKKEEVKTSDKK